MHNNSENQTIKPAQELLTQLGYWATEANQFADIPEQQQTLEAIKTAYLASAFADDNQERGSALVIFKQFEDLFKILGSYKPKHYYKLNAIITKLQSHAIS